jgi:uncharacterized membrane protein YdbT with pleckstrin-like domain
MPRFDPGTFGAPTKPHRHHRTRAILSIAAATCGAIAVLVVGFIVIAGVGPGEGSWAWVALPILVALWLTGFWWRWDSPGRRKRANERVRRGF